MRSEPLPRACRAHLVRYRAHLFNIHHTRGVWQSRCAVSVFLRRRGRALGAIWCWPDGQVVGDGPQRGCIAGHHDLCEGHRERLCEADARRTLYPGRHCDCIEFHGSFQQMAAVVARSEYTAGSVPNAFGGTYGGNAVACAAARATFEVIQVCARFTVSVGDCSFCGHRLWLVSLIRARRRADITTTCSTNQNSWHQLPAR